MERFPVELLYVLGFIAIILFNYIAQRAARRRQQEEEAQAQAAEQAAPPPAEEEPLEDIWGRSPVPPAAAPSAAPVPPARAAPPAIPAAPRAPRRLHPVRALVNERRDLRRAVVLMLVLGPCRSQEPPER